MIEESQVRATIESYVKGWATADLPLWSSLFAEQARLVDPVGTAPIDGKEAIIAFWERTHGMGMTLTPEVTRIVVCGDQAVLLFRMNALTPDGSGMSVDVCDLFTLDSQGKIVELKAYWDKACLRRVKKPA